MRRLAVGIGVLVLGLTGCASSTPSPNPTATLPPSDAVGYWRSPATLHTFQLVYIRQIQDRYFMWTPPSSPHAPLVVEGNRLVRHRDRHGSEIERETFWARRDGTLAFIGSLAKEGGGFATTPVWVFTRAKGSREQLAAELRGRFAEPTIDRQADRLVKALALWANRHDSFPPRSALLPGGAFWSWRGAPHLTNAITGGPMVLGSGAGNFDYTTTGRRSYTLSAHRGYGQPDYTQSGGWSQTPNPSL